MVVTAVAAAARGEGDDKKVPSPPSSSSSSSSQDDAPSPPFLRRLAGAVTLEPVIFFYMFGNAIVQGSAVNTDMLMWKVCRYEFAYNETVCEDLDQDEYEDQEDEVQREVNHVQLIQGWLETAPALVFVFFAGAMSDRMGRKPLILMPLIGLLVGNVSSIVNWAFLEILPLEFFYLEQFWAFFGGLPVYQLGVYGYGSSHTKDPTDRAHVLARYDGVETATRLLGTALSPAVFEALGYYGSFGIRAACTACAIAHLVLVVKEPANVERHVKDEEEKEKRGCLGRLARSIYVNVVLGARDTFGTLLRRRPQGMRSLIALQLALYGLFKFVFAVFEVVYLYLVKVFDGDGKDFSHLKLGLDVIAVFGLLVVVPVMSKRLGLGEPVMLVLFTFIVSVGTFSAAFAGTMLGFFASVWLTALLLCAFGPASALLTRSVEEDEIGKALSGDAIIAAVVPLAAGPIYRVVYDATLNTFPSAFILVAGLASASSCGLSLVLFAQRKKFQKLPGKGGEGEEKPISNSSWPRAVELSTLKKT